MRRVVIAGLSDWGIYANDFCTRENAPGGLRVLASLLAEVWDFDSDIAKDPSDDPSKDHRLKADQVLGKPIRAYYQNPALPSGAPAGSVVIDSNAGRWKKYMERKDSGLLAEVPPLPPERTNSNAETGRDGHDAPSRKPPTPPGVLYTHHLIRDFMFLDAAAANQEASGPAPSVTPQRLRQFTVNFMALDPSAFASEDSALADFTRGTGDWQVTAKHLLDINPPTGNPPAGNSGDLVFHHADVSFSTLLYKLVDLENPPNDIDGGEFSPNWFGVAVPEGIKDFTSVVIYFHPTPGQAGYKDPDYPSKTNGADPTHTYWKELLGYVDRLGAQLAGAIKYAHARPNQIVIMPLMRNVNLDGKDSHVDAGILPRQWYYIVTDILQDLRKRF